MYQSKSPKPSITMRSAALYTFIRITSSETIYSQHFRLEPTYFNIHCLEENTWVRSSTLVWAKKQMQWIPGTCPNFIFWVLTAICPTWRGMECCITWPGIRSPITWSESSWDGLGWVGPGSEAWAANKYLTPLQAASGLLEKHSRWPDEAVIKAKRWLLWKVWNIKLILGCI